MKIHKCAGAWVLLLSFMSCNSNSSSSESSVNDSDEFSEYDYIVDSIGDDAVSHDCAIVFSQLETLQNRWEKIKSPSMLADRRATWKEDLLRIDKERQQLNGEEAQIIDSIRSAILELYSRQCREYSVPASGVISNLEGCIKSLDAVKSRDDLERFRSPRIGMLRNVSTIHLCVEESSFQIGKVRRLADEVKKKYEEKCAKFEVQP